MCFITKKSARAKIAKTDIECWKYINKNLTNAFSILLKHKYKANPVRYVANAIMPHVKLRKTKEESGWNDITHYHIKKGYHSFIYKPSCVDAGWILDNSSETIIAKFIIPEGTRYYQDNERGQYVSETIMLVE
jgi:hypothetical protein